MVHRVERAGLEEDEPKAERLEVDWGVKTPFFYGVRLAAASLLLTVLCLTGSEAVSVPLADPAREQIRRLLENPLTVETVRFGAEPIYAVKALPPFYETRLYAPAWLVAGQLSPAALELLGVIRDIGNEGLEPTDYHLATLEELKRLLDSKPTPSTLAECDVLLTDAFLILGAHLVSGRVNPETFDAEWVAVRREVDLTAALQKALGQGRPKATLMDLLPEQSGYRRLRDSLARFDQVAESGGWPTISDGPALRPGQTDERVGELRARLAVAAMDGQQNVYDEALEEALRRFQWRHGLAEDGVVGEKTLLALNVPASRRRQQIELNLERWRWLPQHLGDRYILVNIPDFRLFLLEEGKSVLEMRVAVGKSYRRTPVFSDTMRYLVLNPFWEVPYKLAVQDKLPEIRKDRDYLARLGFHVYQGWGAEEQEVNPGDVDWSALSASRFPYRLRQDPGPQNALGRVKFMFPNRFNVYLHDTPAREVFQQPERDVSSGCIRLEKPLELAELLLASANRWNREVLEATIAGGRETVVSLDRPLPVHLLYWTAWADDDGTVHFRRDLYERDALLAAALEEKKGLFQKEEVQ